MRVSVDADRCQGHARCWDICPEVFDLDDEGHALVTSSDVPPGLEDKVRDAVRNCPERAITVA
ncbi:MAG TPA: ferredoxin [Acidimicrobiales bacterium]|nr:ferredoxin [Acidimicrobiales bacterium]